MEGTLKSDCHEKSSKVREDFSKEKHVKFFKRSLDILPSGYASLDTSRSVGQMVFFTSHDLYVPVFLLR